METLPGITESTPDHFEQPLSVPSGERGFWIWKRPEWRLVQDYRFTWGPDGAKRRLHIKAGYEWDGSSVPLFGPLLGHFSTGPCHAASLVHDKWCQQKFEPAPGEYQVLLPNGEWVDSPGKWRGLDIHELYRYMCELGGMGKGKAMVRKIAVVLYPPNWK